MYTDEMRRAFHSVTAPKGFSVDLIDNEYFITVRVDELKFFRLSHDQKMEAFEYLIKVKNALEDSGAVVEIMRKALK
jgi:hypothetical protein